MRRVLLLFISVLATTPVYGEPPVWTQSRPSLPVPHIDFSKAGALDARKADSDSDMLLNRPMAPLLDPHKGLLPSVTVGPFRATLGGVDEGRAHLGTYQIDTGDLWNSSISGSVDGRGAKVTFTLPLH